MFEKFRLFSNEVISRLDEQNKIITQLVTMKKSTHFLSNYEKY